MLVVAATASELAFVENADTLCCGIGPVEAALATARALNGRRPSLLLHIGLAGARSIDPPALVIGTEAVYCDLLDEGSPLVRVERELPDAGLLAAAGAALPQAVRAPIATSARVGGGACCDVEAMEGFAVLRAAALAGVPAIELRAISNHVSERDRARWRTREALLLLAGAVPQLLEALDA